jgi:hypothetical protein
VANVWSDAAQTDETVSTCRFAQRMMRITCEVTANVVQDSSARVRQLERCGGALVRDQPLMPKFAVLEVPTLMATKAPVPAQQHCTGALSVVAGLHP